MLLQIIHCHNYQLSLLANDNWTSDLSSYPLLSGKMTRSHLVYWRKGRWGDAISHSLLDDNKFFCWMSSALTALLFSVHCLSNQARYFSSSVGFVKKFSRSPFSWNNPAASNIFFLHHVVAVFLVVPGSRSRSNNGGSGKKDDLHVRYIGSTE